MNSEEIIEVARQAGFSIADGIVTGGVTDVKRFAKQVAEHEREACWQIACDYTQRFNSHTCLAVADAIRARGQA